MKRSSKTSLISLLATLIVLIFLSSASVSATQSGIRATLGIEVGSSATRLSIVVGKNGEPKMISTGPGTHSTPGPLESNWTTEGFLLIKDGTDEALYVHPYNTLFNLDHSIMLRSQHDYGKRPKITGHQAFTLVDITAKYLQELTTSAESILGHNVTFVGVIVPGGQSVRTTTEEIINDEFMGNYTLYDTVNVGGYTEQILNEVRDLMRDALGTAGLRYQEVYSSLYRKAMAAISLFDHSMEYSRMVLVYRLGGSTFEVSVHEVHEGVKDTKSSVYDQHLGGNDFNQRIIDHLLLAHKNKTGQDLSSNDTFLLRLGREVEKAKRVLSFQDCVRIEIESLHPAVQDLSEKLTRSQFEDLNKDLFTKTITAIDQALKDSFDYSKKDIQDIVFSGGSANIPFLQSAVREYFGRHKRYRGSNHPETTVVLGAAKLGDKSRDGWNDFVCCYGADPRAFGIETAGGVMFKFTDLEDDLIFNRMYSFSTTMDNQDRVTVRVFSGDGTRTNQNIYLGGVELTGIAPAPKGVPEIRVRLSSKSCGSTLQLQVMDVTSGRINATKVFHPEDFGGKIKYEMLEGGVYELEPAGAP